MPVMLHRVQPVMLHRLGFTCPNCGVEARVNLEECPKRIRERSQADLPHPAGTGFVP